MSRKTFFGKLYRESYAFGSLRTNNPASMKTGILTKESPHVSEFTLKQEVLLTKNNSDSEKKLLIGDRIARAATKFFVIRSEAP